MKGWWSGSVTRMRVLPAVAWSPVGSAYLAGYEVEFLPASVAVWQGYGAGLGATAAVIPTASPMLTSSPVAKFLP